MLIPLLTEYEKGHISERQALPERYLGLSDEEMNRRIAAARATLGRRLVILGHHYQRDEVIAFADYTGDSYKLAGQVSKHPDAEFIVFCGVHFMAESADVLSGDHQQVILPDLAAGCSMADMAEPDQLEQCWADIEQMLADRRAGSDGRQPVVPVTYINSAASIKAFCGEHGGVVCTSSNAAATLGGRGNAASGFCSCPISISAGTRPTRWACRSIRWLCGIRTRSGADSNPTLSNARESFSGRGTARSTRASRRVRSSNMRAQHPGIRVIVHPEVPWDVVQAADDSGSTEYIIKTVSESPVGSTWAVGTEIHLVNRLATQVQPDRTVHSLDQFGCLCSTMFRVSPNHLLWVLEGLVAGEVHNRIVVPDDQKHWTKVALDRMLSIS